MSEIEQRYPNAQLGDVTTPSTIGGALSATNIDNLVTISVNWSTAAGAWAIANAVGEVSSSHIGQYLDYVVATNYTHNSPAGMYSQPAVSARVVSSASNAVAVSGASSSKVALLAALILIALIVGIALAFLLDYLDDRIRSKEDIRDLFQLPIYGEVPHAPTPGHSARAAGKSAL
jgi:capsular polysaccharide biosynthesis protein